MGWNTNDVYPHENLVLMEGNKLCWGGEGAKALLPLHRIANKANIKN